MFRMNGSQREAVILVKQSREELNSALDSLKEVRKKKSSEEDLLRIVADCYSPMLPPCYVWDKLPGKYICPECGKQFGKDAGKGKRTGKNGGRVSKWDFDALKHVCEQFNKAGYYAEMEPHCSECIQKHGLPQIVFKLRADENEEYVISYPHLKSPEDGFRNDEEELPKKCFFPWQYEVALQFATDSNLKQGGGSEMSCREWLDSLYNNHKHYHREPQNMIYDAIEGILGTPSEDTSE